MLVVDIRKLKLAEQGEHWLLVVWLVSVLTLSDSAHFAPDLFPGLWMSTQAPVWCETNIMTLLLLFIIIGKPCTYNFSSPHFATDARLSIHACVLLCRGHLTRGCVRRATKLSWGLYHPFFLEMRVHAAEVEL